MIFGYVFQYFLKKGGDSETLSKVKEIFYKWCNYGDVNSININASGCNRIEDRKKGINRVDIPKDYIEQISGRMDHVMKPDWHFSGKYNGMHSLNKLNKGDYKFEYLTNNADKDKSKYPYGGKLLVKDEKGVFQEKKTNNGMSSFFPDSWDEKRIAEEVKYAMENNNGYAFSNDKGKGIVGKSKDGTFWIRIQMSEDGKVSSFFPDFEYNPNIK